MTTTHRTLTARATRRDRHVPFSRKPRWALYANSQRMGGNQIFSTRDSVLSDLEVLIDARAGSIFSEVNSRIVNAGSEANCEVVGNENIEAITRDANHVVAAWLDHLAIRVGPPVDFDLDELAAIAVDLAVLGTSAQHQFRADLVQTLPVRPTD